MGHFSIDLFLLFLTSFGEKGLDLNVDPNESSFQVLSGSFQSLPNKCAVTKQ